MYRKQHILWETVDTLVRVETTMLACFGTRFQKDQNITETWGEGVEL